MIWFLKPDFRFFETVTEAAMVRIIADTSTLYSTAQAQDAGFAVSPLSVTINEQTYREFDEISSEEFVSMIHQGHMPTSSQPAVGEVVSLYEEYAGDEILNISMADGLSGTYSSAVAAAELCEARERITVMNSKTLCGPHRHLVEQALRLAREGLDRSASVEQLEALMATEKSYLMPDDFAYLRPDAIYEVHPLSPAFITQGGPSCVAIQVIHN